MAKEIDDLFGFKPEKLDSPVPTRQNITSGRSKREVPLVVALLTFIGMFVTALLMVTPDPQALGLAYLFPLGLITEVGSLLALLPHQHQAKIGPDGRAIVQALFWVTYGIYIALFAAFCRIHKWKWFGLACVILFCLLLLNVSGCHQMLKGLSSIN